MARLLRRTLDSMAIPCSVTAIGEYRVPPQLEVTVCDLKPANLSLDSAIKKSWGNRSMLRCTACLRAFVSTWFKEKLLTYRLNDSIADR